MKSEQQQQQQQSKRGNISGGGSGCHPSSDKEKAARTKTIGKRGGKDEGQ